MNQRRSTVLNIFVISLLMLSILMISGCQKTPAAKEKTPVQITVRDDSGTEVRLDQYPKRIVSLTPSNTEILFALGLGDQVVGVTTYCDYPEEVKQKAKIGDLQGNPEEIVAMKPDLVVAKWTLNEDVVSKLRKLEIPVLCVEPESVEGVYNSIKLIAQVTGTSDKGEEIIAGMKKKIEGAQQKVAGVPEGERVKVFIEVGNEPLFTAGKETFVDELLGLAGGINIAGDIKGYQMYSQETVVKNNPDYILAVDSYYIDVKKEINKRAGWDQIKAVQDGRIITGLDNIVNRPGPRSAQAVETIAQALYPDLYQD